MKKDDSITPPEVDKEKFVLLDDYDGRTFTVTMVNGRYSFIDGKNIKDIFGIIDGLRLQGKRWLKTYDFDGDTTHDVYINIEHIVSIE